MALERVKSITPTTDDLMIGYQGIITAMEFSFTIPSGMSYGEPSMVIISALNGDVKYAFTIGALSATQIGITYVDMTTYTQGSATATISKLTINEITVSSTFLVNGTSVTFTNGSSSVSISGFTNSLYNASYTKGFQLRGLGSASVSPSIYKYKLSGDYYYPQLETTTNALSFSGDGGGKYSECANCAYEAFVVTFTTQPESYTKTTDETMSALMVSASPCVSVDWKKSADGISWSNVGTGNLYTPEKVVGKLFYKATINNNFYGNQYTRDSNVATVSVRYDINQMIFDRTQADIDYANEICEKIKNGTNTPAEFQWWLQMSKSRYNYTDLNRVGYGLAEAKTQCDEVSITVTYPYSIKQDYSATDVLTTNDVSHILANVSALKTALSTWIQTNVPTEIKRITDANAIEFIIYQVPSILENIKSTYRYSAEIYCGEQY